MKPHHARTLLSSEEEQQQLEAWNDTAVEYEREQCIHEQFEKQVERTPDVVAVVYGGQR